MYVEVVRSKIMRNEKMERHSPMEWQDRSRQKVFLEVDLKEEYRVWGQSGVDNKFRRRGRREIPAKRIRKTTIMVYKFAVLEHAIGQSGKNSLAKVLWVPLHVWTKEFIAKLASRWGELILVDSRTKNRSNLIYTRVQVHIQITENIAGGTKIKVDGVLFQVRVSEEMLCMEEPEQEGRPPEKQSPNMEGARLENRDATCGKMWEPTEDTEKATVVSKILGVQKAPRDTKSRGDDVRSKGINEGEGILNQVESGERLSEDLGKLVDKER
ncbi:hypothetical protein Ancab_039300 [Ancistrocladus abbreviatus]